jgi:lipoprotein signal peptidase
MGVVWPFIID